MSYLTTHAAVRLRPLAPDKWEVSHLQTKTRTIASAAAASLCAAFVGGAESDSVVLQLSRISGCPKVEVAAAVAALKDAGFLVSPTDGSHLAAELILRRWCSFGWRDAADYHLATIDYPFVDYSQSEGIDYEARAMQRYLSEEREIGRARVRPCIASAKVAKDTTKALALLGSSIGDVLERVNSPDCSTFQSRSLSSETIGDVCSIAFGQMGSRKESNGSAPLLLKASPSGGSRHPTEGYVLIMRSCDLAAGLYHYEMPAQALKRLCELPPADVLERMFAGPFRARLDRNFEPAAVVILTSVFERNMFRYREPRTFRTILLDIGHVVFTLELACAALGLQFYPQHGVDDLAVERLLGLEGLDEGVMYAVAIG